jgi:hypothetical protein
MTTTFFRVHRFPRSGLLLIEHRFRKFHSCSAAARTPSIVPAGFCRFAGQRWPTNVVLGSGLQTCATNSPRAGYDLRRACKGSESPRRSAQCRPSDGRKPFRPRDSLAPGGGPRRKTAYPRTLRQLAAQVARKRRRGDDGTPREHEIARLDPGEKEEPNSPTEACFAKTVKHCLVSRSGGGWPSILATTFSGSCRPGCPGDRAILHFQHSAGCCFWLR